MSQLHRVNLGQRSYDIEHVDLGRIQEAVSNHFAVTDANVAKSLELAGDRLHIIRPGEASKSMATYRQVLDAMARAGLKRGDTLFAVGGGVVGDLAGFAAATYMRGIPFVQVPTSLLAMVDSSVGGKVGIDLPAGKNLVGAFHQPTAVWIAPEVLRTLPRRHVTNGLAEVLKYAFILDPQLLDLIDGTDWIPTVVRSIQLKALVVEEDEHETTGRRAILNFGHTIGHAIEAELNYRHLLHGEAVAIGMVFEAKLGEELGVTPRGLSEEVTRVLRAHKLPVDLPHGLKYQNLLDRMKLDKKADGEGLAFSLLTGLGECKLYRGIDPAPLLNLLAIQ